MGRPSRNGWFSARYSMGKRRNRRNHSTRAESRRLRLEQLEQRTLLAAFSVTNANNAGAGSLHQAILDANAATGADSITFASGLAGATIDAVGLTITDDVDIQGPLNGPVILSGRSVLFRNFTSEGRILDIAAGANVSLSRLTLKNGDVSNKEGFNPPGEAFGGAIRNAGTLTVRECLFYHNAAAEPNDGLGAGGGGAIYNSGTLTVIASSFAANFAEWGSGGAIYNAGTATVTNSTFIDNYIGKRGGAIFNDTLGTLTVNHCTILKSGGDPAAHLFNIPLGSGGITNWGTMAMNNTIVADTPVGSDVENISIITGSHNLIKDGSGNLPGTNFTGDPMLTPPVYTSFFLLPKPGEAGPPFTLPPLPGSPAIDAGNNSAVSSAVDQRGAPRINNGVVDIGAVEVGIAPVSIAVTTLSDEDNASIDPALGAGTSLREALSLMLPEDVTITFAPGLAGTIALDAALTSLRISDFDNSVPFERGDVTIVGPGVDVITIDGLAQTRILAVDSVVVSISSLTFARGAANDIIEGGGAIYNTSGSLTVSDCAFLDNTATFAGGAIHSSQGPLIVNNCTFAGNSSDHGGAIANESEMTVTDSTFTENAARRGGAIWAQSFDDPPVTFNRPTVTSSTFSENSATEYGGAIFIASYAGFSSPAELSVINSTISNNSAGLNGGGIHVEGNLNLYGSTVYGNSAASAGPVVAGGIAIADIVEDESYVRMVTLVNNIVAGSTSGADLTIYLLENGTVTGSHNLIGDGSGGLPNTITGDPMLAPLADNGGPTQTHALLPGSPAIDAGDPAFDPNDPDGDPMTDDALPYDQRGSGFTRLIGNAVDIGAFELQTAPLAGDYNRSGTVDAADYVLWRKTLDATGVTPFSGADGDGNSAIEQADNTVWRSNFGLILPNSGSGTSNMAGHGSTAAASAKTASNVGAASAIATDLVQTRSVGQEPLVTTATTVSASSQRDAAPVTRLDSYWLAGAAGSPQIRSERHIAATLERVDPLPHDYALLAWYSSYQSNNQIPTENYSSVRRSNEGARDFGGAEHSALDEIFADLAAR